MTNIIAILAFDVKKMDAVEWRMVVLEMLCMLDIGIILKHVIKYLGIIGTFL